MELTIRFTIRDKITVPPIIPPAKKSSCLKSQSVFDLWPEASPFSVFGYCGVVGDQDGYYIMGLFTEYLSTLDVYYIN